MVRKNKVIVAAILLQSGIAVATDLGDVPSECRLHTETVALIDCLQNQQEILQNVLKYHETVSKISDVRSRRQAEAPSVIEPESREPDPVVQRVNWFDQQLEVYAIVGSPTGMTAYARLGDREYRLQEGDSIRLAKVKKVHPRGLELLVSGHEISIGLSGRRTTSIKKSDSREQ